MEIKRYKLTERAEQQYRKGAKQAKDIPLPVLECKLSSLIYASKDRYYYSDEDATIAFGSCLITFLTKLRIFVGAKNTTEAESVDRKRRSCLKPIIILD